MAVKIPHRRHIQTYASQKTKCLVIRNPMACFYYSSTQTRCVSQVILIWKLAGDDWFESNRALPSASQAASIFLIKAALSFTKATAAQTVSRGRGLSVKMGSVLSQVEDIMSDCAC